MKQVRQHCAAITSVWQPQLNKDSWAVDEEEVETMKRGVQREGTKPGRGWTSLDGGYPLKQQRKRC